MQRGEEPAGCGSVQTSDVRSGWNNGGMQSGRTESDTTEVTKHCTYSGIRAQEALLWNSDFILPTNTFQA